MVLLELLHISLVVEEVQVELLPEVQAVLEEPLQLVEPL
jgi:hypothetical protein